MRRHVWQALGLGWCQKLQSETLKLKRASIVNESSSWSDVCGRAATCSNQHADVVGEVGMHFLPGKLWI